MSVTGSDTERSDQRTFTAKGLATRERIVEVAAALMYSGGVAGTSWEDVQNGAGVSASQLNHYFGDKQGPSAPLSHIRRAHSSKANNCISQARTVWKPSGHGAISWSKADGKSNAKVAAPWEALPANCSRHTRSVARISSTDSTVGRRDPRWIADHV